MTNTEYLIELSMLSTVLFAHHQYKDEQYFNDLELQEEWFQIPFHRLVVKNINYNKQLKLPTYEEFICESLIQDGIMDGDLWLKIIGANPFSKVLFEKYLVNLEKHSDKMIEGI